MQQDTQGPYAESSSLADDAWRMVRLVPGVAEAANVTYLTMQVRRRRPPGRRCAAMVVGLAPATQAATAGLAAAPGGRAARRRAADYEAVADVATGLALGEEISPAPPPLPGGGADAAHGLLQRRPDGVHPPEGCAGGAVSQRQRCHLAPTRPHGQQPGLQPSGAAAGAGCRECQPGQQHLGECRLGAPGPWGRCRCRGRHHGPRQALHGVYPCADARGAGRAS